MLLCGLAAALFFGYVVVRGARRGNDFKYPYLAAKAYWKTSHIHLDVQPRYPLSFHVLLSPLASLPIGVAATIWAALAFASVAALPRVMQELTGLPPRRQLLGWLVVLPGFIDALVLGQSDPINLFLVASAVVAARRGRTLTGVGLIGLAGMIKILPFLHWGTIIARDQSRRVWLGMAMTVCFAFSVLAAAVGWDSACSGIGQQWTWISRYEKPWHLVERGSDLRVNNESLPIVLARTLGDLGPDRPLHSLSLGLFSIDLIWRMWGAILMVLATVWVVCAWLSRGLEPQRAWLGMFALTSAVMLAGTPICWHHYFLWLLPATLYLADRPRWLRAALVLSWLGTALPPARGIGCHALLSLGMFAAVATDLIREARLGVTVSDGSNLPGAESSRIALSRV
jgi:alpha-1,2-mannosyltransferase